jgi:hypothetical protein
MKRRIFGNDEENNRKFQWDAHLSHMCPGGGGGGAGEGGVLKGVLKDESSKFCNKEEANGA